MNNKNLILLISLLLVCSLSATASDIYKRINPDGTVEYSFRPGPVESGGGIHAAVAGKRGERNR